MVKCNKFGKFKAVLSNFNEFVSSMPSGSPSLNHKYGNIISRKPEI